MIHKFKMFELVTSIKETQYSFKEMRGYFHHDLIDYRYTFKTNSGTKYKLDLKAIKEKNIIFNDNSELNDYSLNKKNNYNICYVISYTLYERNHFNYDEETNKFEHYELLSKIMFLLQDFIKKYSNNNIFVIGSTNSKKIKFYSNYFKSFNIKLYEAYSESYKDNFLYLIF